jgi:hypothetical protein
LLVCITIAVLGPVVFPSQEYLPNPSKTLVKEFYIHGKNGDWLTVMVEYDWVLPMCSACKVLGHSLAACPKSKKITLRRDFPLKF